MYASSDRRLKRDIELIPLEEAKRLLNVDAVSYRWKKDLEKNYERDIGLLAQDVLKAGLDKLVSVCPNSDKETFPMGYNYGLEYEKVPIYLLELVKDLYKIISDQQEQLEALKDYSGKIANVRLAALPTDRASAHSEFGRTPR